MSGSLAILLGALSLSTLHNNSYGGDNTTYYKFPKFWTNSGLCPLGNITHRSITDYLRSDTMQGNLLHLSALPHGALTHLRIHWLLELLEFQQFTQSGLPIFDFSLLDEFLIDLDMMNINPVVEFMGNFSNLFEKNPTYNDVIWDDLTYQVTKRYLNMFGAKKVLNWRFETWNEPDVISYNKLNFSLKDYVIYANSIKQGLIRAGARPTNSLHIPLRGPAGLFKKRSHHPICWGILEHCNANIDECPIDILTFHRKGSSPNASVILDESVHLLSDIYKAFPNIQQLLFSNDEADPLAGWSMPRDFQEDVRYALTFANIVLDHWKAKLDRKIFAHFEDLSNDNAFLSYHPFEFSQRTLLAHFRMNNSVPPYSQFIQKPIYAAMGMLSRLADMAASPIAIKTSNGLTLNVLKTTANKGQPMYSSWLVVPANESAYVNTMVTTNFHLCGNEVNAFIVEVIDQQLTNPVRIWRQFNSPPYPNSTVREVMRFHQTMKIHDTGISTTSDILLKLSNLSYPWLMLLRMCSNLNGLPDQPQNLQITRVTKSEVILTWQESTNSVSQYCLKTYQVWFRENQNSEWLKISNNWHLPFPFFQYAPVQNSQIVNGFYKVRSVDVFNRTSSFSAEVQYIEI
ncbi:alpha-L-iduronidase [Musca vetustissima]|uniref:alpha-L-iduronidase n=1 Tax=Musca vetustissima TaxID=27455 RepID=UPI002AB70600|nr:alpha-L-iduronidase [Musca vetustissima]